MRHDTMICRRKVLRRKLLAFVICGISMVGGFDLCPVERNRLPSLRRWRFSSGMCLFKNDELIANDASSESSSSTSKAPNSRPHLVHFAAPLLDYGHPPAVEEFQNETMFEKPIFLYLPGFDGTYIAPFIQYPELGTEFEVWCMTVGSSDRTTFDELKVSVLDFIENFGSEDVAASSSMELMSEHVESLPTGGANGKTNASNESGGPFWSGWFSSSANKKPSPTKIRKRSLYLVGESFGGILASEIALTLLETPKKFTSNVDLQGMVLINPATCYDRSQLAAKGPSVASLPPLLYPFGLTGLIPLFADEYSFEQLILILTAKALPSVIDNPVRESFMGRVAFSLPAKLEYMSQGTLEWRLEEWLRVGCEKMEYRIRDYQDHPSFRTLILVGENDLTLPSIAEAERLVNLLPKCQVHVVEGAGHASTCGSRMDMTALLRETFLELRKPNNSKDKRKPGEAKRTAMKPEATNGTGPYFGMEPRYDGASIGLNPFLYWSKDNHKPVQKDKQERQVMNADANIITTYSAAIYRLR